MRGTVICDGRGNAGTGACAAIAYIDGREAARDALKLPPVSNIVAEHKSIQLAIVVAARARIDELMILNDSQTPVYQVSGKYRINAEHLIPIVHETWEMANNSFFFTTDIEWVPREQTDLADRLCRLVDTGSIPPDMTMQDLKKQNPEPRSARRARAAQARLKRPNPFLSLSPSAPFSSSAPPKA